MRYWLTLNGGDPDDLFALSDAAEAAGFNGVVLNDGTFQPIEQGDSAYPYTEGGARSWDPETPFLDPVVMLAAIGARNPGLRVMPWVCKLPLRTPLILAKELATAALMTGDRFDFGIGLSWLRAEFDALGIDWRARRERFAEQIDALRLLLTGDAVQFHGAHIDFGPVMMRPAPASPMRFILSGHGPKALEFAARVGDGWCGVLGPQAALVETLEALRVQLDAADREPADFPLWGGAVEAQRPEDFEQLAARGLTDAIVMPWGARAGGASTGAADADRSARLDAIAAFGDAVIVHTDEQLVGGARR